MGADDADKRRDSIVESCLHRIDSTNFKPTQGNPYVGYSLLRSMESIVRRPAGMTDATYATRVLSSSDLPYILSNTAEKVAQNKYTLTPVSFSAWAGSSTLRNYKTKDLIRSGDFPALQEVAELGEIKNGSFGEEKETVALRDFGIIMGLSKQSLINDDMGEIQKVMSQAGASARLRENQLVYEVLTSNPDMGDGTDLFHASHGNLAASGNAAALSDTTIGYAFESMRGQTSVDGLHTLNVAPEYLITGPSQEVLARKYLAQISPTQASNVNVFSNSLKLIVDSSISTNDYFFAAPHSLIPTVTLFRLAGQEAPQVSTQLNFRNQAFEIRLTHSCVAKAEDWRGLHKNPNAS